MKQAVAKLGMLVNAAMIAVFVVALGTAAAAQSTSQDFPTAVLANEINGRIDPRPVGDPRSTTHYYYFDGGQGDIFINIVTENLNGDIDVFAQDGLRMLSRVVILADDEPSETGRVVYLRKPERILLRVQGRTPNDEPAIYRIKFAGSFVAIREEDAIKAPEMPTVPRRETERAAAEEKAQEPKKAELPDRIPVERKTDADAPARAERETAETRRSGRTGTTPPVTGNTRPPATRDRATTPPPTTPPTSAAASKVPKEIEALANFKLVIEFKDGSRIERPMTEVNRFTVEKGILLVFGKDGRIGRYSMADVARVGIESSL